MDKQKILVQITEYLQAASAAQAALVLEFLRGLIGPPR